MSIKIITPEEVAYTKIEDKKGIYKKGDPECVWCKSSKDLYRNEKTETYCCKDCKK